MILQYTNVITKHYVITSPHILYLPYDIDDKFNVMFAERYDNKQLLYVHLYHSFADQGGTEKRPERHQKVTACDTGKIEQWVWYLEKMT